jgi:voltage-dependent calcium channel T type alpha-1G
MSGPLDDHESEYSNTLNKIDLATTIIFIVEGAIKIMIFGLIFNGKSSYLRKPWYVLDFIIVFFSIISLTPIQNDLKVIKVLRILRLISRHEGLQVAVRALYHALPNILNVTVIMLIFFLIFGVIGVSQFKGKFYFCAEKLDELKLDHKWDCLNAGGVWDNQVYTFDDIPNAMITLFVMATTAGWQDVLINSITSTDIDYVAQEYRDPYWSLFFILFLVIGFFFFLNLFIGVVVTTFNSEVDKLGGNDLLTEK